MHRLSVATVSGKEAKSRQRNVETASNTQHPPSYLERKPAAIGQILACVDPCPDNERHYYAGDEDPPEPRRNPFQGND